MTVTGTIELSWDRKTGLQKSTTGELDQALQPALSYSTSDLAILILCSGQAGKPDLREPTTKVTVSLIQTNGRKTEDCTSTERHSS